MPKWPAWLMLGFAVACAYPAMTTQAPAAEETQPYLARGQEPGWALTIGHNQIDYSGDYGERRISVARPEPRAIPNGERFEAGRLVISITRGPCNDAMSGFGFADQVTVIADGKTYQGCGGERRPDWDM